MTLRLADRVIRCLLRTEELCDRLVKDHAYVNQQLDGDVDIGDAVALHHRLADELVVAQEEIAVLLQEWRRTIDADEHEQAAVKAHAARVQERVHQALNAQQESRSVLAQKLSSLGGTLTAMRQGKATLRQYRAGDDEAPDYVDRNA